MMFEKQPANGHQRHAGERNSRCAAPISASKPKIPVSKDQCSQHSQDKKAQRRQRIDLEHCGRITSCSLQRTCPVSDDLKMDELTTESRGLDTDRDVIP